MRFKLHKSHGVYIVEDELDKLPALTFTDLTTALRCFEELNKLGNENSFVYKEIREAIRVKQDATRDRLNTVRSHPPLLTNNIPTSIDRDAEIKRLIERIKCFQEILEEY